MLSICGHFSRAGRGTTRLATEALVMAWLGCIRRNPAYLCTSTVCPYPDRLFFRRAVGLGLALVGCFADRFPGSCDCHRHLGDQPWCRCFGPSTAVTPKWPRAVGAIAEGGPTKPLCATMTRASGTPGSAPHDLRTPTGCKPRAASEGDAAIRRYAAIAQGRDGTTRVPPLVALREWCSRPPSSVRTTQADAARPNMP